VSIELSNTKTSRFDIYHFCFNFNFFIGTGSYNYSKVDESLTSRARNKDKKRGRKKETVRERGTETKRNHYGTHLIIIIILAPSQNVFHEVKSNDHLTELI